MEIRHINHNQVISSFANKNEAESTSPQIVSSHASSQVVASTAVLISDEASVRQLIDEQIRTTIPYVEKSDEEYRAMSFEQLIDERNGERKDYSVPGGLMLKVVITHPDGKAAQAAQQKLAEQTVANNLSALNLKQALADFKAGVTKDNPEFSRANFDIGFKNGKPVIISDSLSKQNIDKLQKILDDQKQPQSVKLRNSIHTYNKEALTTINMRIYEESGLYGGKDSELVHRNNPLTLKEFTTGISYEKVGNSNGNFTFNKHLEIIGSTQYGAVKIYKSNAQ